MPKNNPEQEQVHSYWRFSLDVYVRPGVAPACLDLQDRVGLDVNVLLMALLAARIHERAITSDEIGQADQSIAAWREQVVIPLRKIRTRIKTGPYPAPNPDTEALRNKLKALELEAEHVEQGALAAWIRTLAAGTRETTDGHTCTLTADRVVDFYADKFIDSDNTDIDNRAALHRSATVIAHAAMLPPFEQNAIS